MIYVNYTTARDDGCVDFLGWSLLPLSEVLTGSRLIAYRWGHQHRRLREGRRVRRTGNNRRRLRRRRMEREVGVLLALLSLYAAAAA
jgi:hypothetical protein